MFASATLVMCLLHDIVYFGQTITYCISSLNCILSISLLKDIDKCNDRGHFLNN